MCPVRLGQDFKVRCRVDERIRKHAFNMHQTRLMPLSCKVWWEWNPGTCNVIMVLVRLS